MTDDGRIIELARRTGLSREEAVKFYRLYHALRAIEANNHDRVDWDVVLSERGSPGGGQYPTIDQ